MAIRRWPRLVTPSGQEVKVEKWIACNTDCEFGSAIFEVEGDAFDESEATLEFETGETYTVTFHKLSLTDNVRVSGRISR